MNLLSGVEQCSGISRTDFRARWHQYNGRAALYPCTARTIPISCSTCAASSAVSSQSVALPTRNSRTGTECGTFRTRSPRSGQRSASWGSTMSPCHDSTTESARSSWLQGQLLSPRLAGLSPAKHSSTLGSLCLVSVCLSIHVTVCLVVTLSW